MFLHHMNMKLNVSLTASFLIGLSLVVLPMVASAASPVQLELYKRYVGTSDNMYLGSQLITVPDMTGDELDDYLIKDLSSDGTSYSHVARILAGNAAGPVNGNLDRPAVATIYGELDRGLGTIEVMDVNADGQVDVITTHGNDMGGTFGAYVFYGLLSGSYTPADADAEFISNPVMYPYVRVTSTPDVTGDGQPELVFYQQYDTDGSSLPVGEIYIFTTPLTDTTINITEDYTARVDGTYDTYTYNYDYLGLYSPIAGDFNHDDQNDLIVPGFGVSYIIPGPVNGQYEAFCKNDGYYFVSCTSYLPGGYTLSAGEVVLTQDINADTFDDFVIIDEDTIYGFTSAITGDTTTADADIVVTSDTTIRNILPLADQNADGKMELIIWNETNAYVSNGLQSDDLANIGRPRFSLFLSKPTDTYKYTTAAKGDYNGDGKIDVLVSAPMTDRSGKTRNGIVRQFNQL